MPLPTGTRLGVYEILASIGAGGMGEVYRARDTKLGRDVALKLLPESFAGDPERMARFEREAQVLASLNHPNIAIIYGFEESNGVRALVMELVEGPTLAERIGGRAMPLDEALPIAKQIADGLEYAHERGIIHRDLKPANVKLTADGSVKILDFGLAKALDTSTPQGNPSTSPTLTLEGTRAGVILGTAAYMAPEQARGAVVDRRADIWALGVVLYEMLTGKQPFAGETTSDTLAAVLKSEPDLTQVPAQVRRLLRLCLEKDPKGRLRDIGDFPILCQEAPRQMEGVAPPRRALVWMGVSGLLLLSLGALAFLHFRQVPPAERVLRLSVPIPENRRVQGFALSPDGRHLVMSLVSGGKSNFWLRALDSSQLQPLLATENASDPFWSADSRSIGFFADGKLKTIPASGGTPQILCDAEVGGWGPGTWSRDGVILFTSRGPLQRVEATGGACTPINKVESGNNSLVYPVFLPDGKNFFYVVSGDLRRHDSLRGDEAKRGVYLGTLEDPTGRRVLTDRSSVAFVPPSSGIGPGHVLFVRDTTLMARPFDAGTLQLAGDEFPVVGPVSMTSVSQNGVLVYLTNSLPDSQLIWFDRSGKQQAKVGLSSLQYGVSLSPDEKVVAYYDHGRGGIWLRELIRSVETRFTFPPLFGGAAVWSPDGGRIAFSTFGGDLYRKDASGSGQEEVLLPKGNPKYPSDWSRDGRYLLYKEVDPKTRGDLWILPDPSGKSGGGTPVPFLRTEFIESQGQFSPDGRWIAYASDESGHGQFEVYVRPFPSGAGKWKVSSNGGLEPRWRSDGKELFYLEPDGLIHRLMAAPIPTGSRLDFKADAPKALFAFRGPTNLQQSNAFAYSVAANGERFLVSVQVNTSDPMLNVIVNWEKAASVKER
jgi:serine/threonine protein kinase